MGYGTILHNGYIIAVTDIGDMTEQEYTQTVNALHNKPADAPDGYAYRLRTDLTWELTELPPAPAEPTNELNLEDLSKEELINIILSNQEVV